MKSAVVALIITLVFPALCSAGIYKWVDEKGVTHYSNTPPADASQVESRTATVNPKKE